MAETFPKLFEPVSIGKVTLKNRIAMAPMGIVGLTNPDGSPTQRAIDYYTERARGGIGLIITGLFKVENEIESIVDRLELISRASLAPLGELCDTVHALGTKMFVQLTAGFGRVARPSRVRDNPVSASAIPNYWDPSITCRPLAMEEVETIVEAFGNAAEIAAVAGVDGIELHGHEGYLFDQFTTAIWNKRTDKYGGDLRNRLTFPIEVLMEIKKRLGNDFPVQYRFGLKHYIKGLNSGALRGEHYAEAGRDVEEGLEMAKLLEEAGFDALHVDAGCYDSWYWAHPPTYQGHGCMVDMAAKVKEIVRIPVIAVGRLEIPELAEEIIEEGKADIVALGRGLLADAHWPIKVRQGTTEDIRPCLGCHCCFVRFEKGRPLSCAVNPACGRERLYQLIPAEKPKNIMVVGGGVAGMEAARVASIRGHKVTIYERGKALGGHLIEASVPDFKKDLKRLTKWYETQLDKLDIEVNLETEVSPAFIDKRNQDVVLIATGSKPIIPELLGIEKDNVLICIDLLLGKKKAGKTIVVIGGGLIGCEIALWLSEKDKEVTIVETLPELMRSGIPVPHMNRIMLLDLLAANKVNIVTNASLQEITDEGIIIVDKASGRSVIEADNVVLALGMKSDDELYREALKGNVAHVYALGDCQEPRNIMGAVWDAYEVSRMV